MGDQFGAMPESSSDQIEHVGGPVAANVAHELCNQLQVVESAINLIQRSTQASACPALDKVFALAHLALDRTGRLTRSIIDMRAHCAGVARRVSIVEHLASLPELGLLGLASNIQIEQHICDNVPDILCDPDAFADAILNMVVNARRAMPGGGRILISAVREDQLDGPPLAVLRIADNGCGMSPETASRAFDPNFTTRPRGEGSGIGLAMVADFARSAGGVAQLESRLGVGTVAILRLPGFLKPAFDPRGFL